MQNNLKDIRKSRTSYTQEQAAGKIGVKLETYRKWEQGKVQLTSKHLIMLAKFYGCTVDDICCDAVDVDEQMERLIYIYNNLTSDGRLALLATAEGLFSQYAVKNNLNYNKTSNGLTA